LSKHVFQLSVNEHADFPSDDTSDSIYAFITDELLCVFKVYMQTFLFELLLHLFPWQQPMAKATVNKYLLQAGLSIKGTCAMQKSYSAFLFNSIEACLAEYSSVLYFRLHQEEFTRIH